MDKTFSLNMVFQLLNSSIPKSKRLLIRINFAQQPIKLYKISLIISCNIFAQYMFSSFLKIIIINQSLQRLGANYLEIPIPNLFNYFLSIYDLILIFTQPLRSL